MVNSLSNNFPGLYNQGTVRSSLSQGSGMTQGSSSYSNGLLFSTGGTITRVQHGIPSFGMSSMSYPQQGPFSAIPNVAT